MKKLLLSALLFLAISFTATAGERNDRIASFAFQTPNNVAGNRRNLALYLTKPYHNDYDKLQAIAYWIASHIAYDGYKYSNGETSRREMQYEYDVLQYRTGICSDFAGLFTEMANIAGISGVETVSGYVLENQNRIKLFYNTKDVAKETGHAWNRVQIGKRAFFVDTTFMSRGSIGEEGIRPASTFKHKYDVKNRRRINDVNTHINDFFFDFTPKQEFNKFRTVHLMNKYIR